VTWEATVYDGQLAFSSVDTDVRVVIVPGVGGKIVSITGASGREHVWRQPHRQVRPIPDGRDFADGDISGIDDCFPTVDPCVDPGDPVSPTPLRDHGDVWHRSWEVTVSAPALSLRTTGSDLPYTLTKHLTVDGGRLLVEYELTTDLRPFVYQWTGHLLLDATAGRRIEISGSPIARTAFTSPGRLRTNGTGETWTWPAAPGTDGSAVDLSVISSRDTAVNEKVWLNSPSDGTCRLQADASGEDVVVEFDPQQLPWLAICTDYGGWPADDPAYWVAIEPSTSDSDALADSARTGTARTVEPGETHRWWWSLRLDATSR
jgi:galactose mutarotase-like enzyme